MTIISALKSIISEWEKIMAEIDDMVAEHLVTNYDMGMEEAAELVKTYKEQNADDDLDDMEIEELAEAVYSFTNA